MDQEFIMQTAYTAKNSKQSKGGDGAQEAYIIQIIKCSNFNKTINNASGTGGWEFRKKILPPDSCRSKP